MRSPSSKNWKHKKILEKQQQVTELKTTIHELDVCPCVKFVIEENMMQSNVEIELGVPTAKLLGILQKNIIRFRKILKYELHNSIKYKLSYIKNRCTLLKTVSFLNRITCQLYNKQGHSADRCFSLDKSQNFTQQKSIKFQFARLVIETHMKQQISITIFKNKECGYCLGFGHTIEECRKGNTTKKEDQETRRNDWRR